MEAWDDLADVSGSTPSRGGNSFKRLDYDVPEDEIVLQPGDFPAIEPSQEPMKEAVPKDEVEWDTTDAADECAIPYTADGQTSSLMANLILTHNKENVMQGTLELVQEIYNPFDLFVIHIDTKVAESEAGPWRRNFQGCKNILFTRERYDIAWASWEIVAAELAMLKVALASDNEWKYSMFMDGGASFAVTKEGDHYSHSK